MNKHYPTYTITSTQDCLKIRCACKPTIVWPKFSSTPTDTYVLSVPMRTLTKYILRLVKENGQYGGYIHYFAILNAKPTWKPTPYHFPTIAALSKLNPFTKYAKLSNFLQTKI